MNLNLEKEQKRLARYEEWHKAQHMNYPELLQQRKLVSALEQLEQAREALFHMITFGDREWAIQKAKQVLKQQEVG